jgi:microcompartment protein CcmK/EutM
MDISISISAGHADVVEYLVLQGSDVDLVDVKCQTSLYMAVKHKHLECIKILLRAGANPNGDLMSLCTPLYIAAMDGYYEGVMVSTGCSGIAYHSETECMNIPLDAAILPVRLLSAQKQNLVISQTPDETPELYACTVTIRKRTKSTAPWSNFPRQNLLITIFGGLKKILLKVFCSKS